MHTAALVLARKRTAHDALAATASACHSLLQRPAPPRPFAPPSLPPPKEIASTVSLPPLKYLHVHACVSMRHVRGVYCVHPASAWACAVLMTRSCPLHSPQLVHKWLGSSTASPGARHRAMSDGHVRGYWVGNAEAVASAADDSEAWWFSRAALYLGAAPPPPVPSHSNATPQENSARRRHRHLLTAALARTRASQRCTMRSKHRLLAMATRRRPTRLSLVSALHLHRLLRDHAEQRA